MSADDDFRFLERGQIRPSFQIGDAAWAFSWFVGAIFLFLAALFLFYLGLFFVMLFAVAGGLAFLAYIGRKLKKAGSVLWPRLLADKENAYFLADAMGKKFMAVPWRRVRSVEQGTIWPANARGLFFDVDVSDLDDQELKFFKELAYTNRDKPGMVRIGVISGFNKRDELVEMLKSFKDG